MNKHFFSLILFLLGGFITVQAQCKQDSLLFQHLLKTGSSPKLVVGKTYYFEISKQHSSPEYSKSLLIKEKDTPKFIKDNRLINRYQLVNALPYTEFGDNPIVLKKITMDTVNTGMGTVPCFILTFTCNKQNYRSFEFSESSVREWYNLYEADIFNEANKLLDGKTLYTKSANWLKYNEKEINSNLELTNVREGTCKYCPVTVTRVVNQYNNDFLILFKPENQNEEYCFSNIQLNTMESDFFHYFTLENPHEKYPNISQEHWDLIMAQKVKKGFTPEEVKIAYGEPEEVSSENDDETWIYYNLNKKDYQISFKDGVVDKVLSQTSQYY